MPIIDVDLPRNALVVFTGISGSGKSSWAFGTLFAESQRRYLDSVSPYARRLIDQVDEPDVDALERVPPAWQGQNLSRILTTLGHDIDKPWHTLPKKTRDWILFTDETPTVPVYPEYNIEQTREAIETAEKPNYMGLLPVPRTSFCILLPLLGQVLAKRGA
jgi:excinuclease UvrABC ATPase subunit